MLWLLSVNIILNIYLSSEISYFLHSFSMPTFYETRFLRQISLVIILYFTTFYYYLILILLFIIPCYLPILNTSVTKYVNDYSISQITIWRAEPLSHWKKKLTIKEIYSRLIASKHSFRNYLFENFASWVTSRQKSSRKWCNLQVNNVDLISYELKCKFTFKNTAIRSKISLNATSFGWCFSVLSEKSFIFLLHEPYETPIVILKTGGYYYDCANATWFFLTIYGRESTVLRYCDRRIVAFLPILSGRPKWLTRVEWTYFVPVSSVYHNW